MVTNLDRVREIVREGQYKKIGRFVVDGISAKAILLVYDSLTGERKEKYLRIINSDIRKAASIAWKLVH
jgi:hypothetical protein